MNSDSDDNNKEGTYEDDCDNDWSASSFDSRPPDLTLLVGEYEFCVHKDVLERSCDYFRAMFSSQMIECSSDKITLSLAEPKPLQVLLEGFYTGTIKLNAENVCPVVSLSQILQLNSNLSTQCTDFLNGMINDQFCFIIMYFCVPINLQEVYSHARRYCLAHFSELRHCQSFLDLTLSELYNYLSDKHLVVEKEIHVVQALNEWFCRNEIILDSEDNGAIRNRARRCISSCVHLKQDIPGALEIAIDAVLGDVERHSVLENTSLQNVLGERPKYEDIFLFWSLLQKTKADGLVDVVQLCPDTGDINKFDSMTDVVEEPGYDLGSALCTHGPYVYLSGGGPNFGKINWIRQIWRFDMSKPKGRWETVGDLFETRRHHAMVAIGNKLYIFGGFGRFRTRNTKLDSFDLLTGLWDHHPPMQTYEIKPLATSYNNEILYLDSFGNLHSFNTIANQWSTLHSTYPVINSPHCPRPVALHAVCDGDTNALLVLLDEKTRFKIRELKLDQQNQFTYDYAKGNAEFENELKFEGSVVANGQLVMFFGSHKGDDPVEKKDEKDSIQCVRSFDPVSHTFTDLGTLNDVTKVLSFVALSHIPTTFRTKLREF